MGTHPKRQHHGSYSATSPQPPLPTTSMEMEEEEEEEALSNFPIPNPSVWFIKLISLQAEITYNCIVALFSPFFSILSFATESFHQAKETKENVKTAVHAAAKVPSTVAHGSSLLVKKVGLGFLGAAYVCMVLVMVMIVAVILGVGLVHLWVEEPVFMRESLHFDYTDVHPTAVFSFRGSGGVDTDGFEGYGNKKKTGVPVGHTFYISLVLLMPESDYNREIGVFQLTAQLISRNRDVMATSSHPCMLRFTSWPIRVVRTLFMGIPLLLGITAETQRITIAMLKHKEGFPRSEAIRITLVPRAGTPYLPQLYEAEILMNSYLPWRKDLIYRWKWTFYVWTSFYMYILLLIILFVYFKPLIFPVMTITSSDRGKQEVVADALTEQREKAREERDVSETLRRWHRTRSKRKAMLLNRSVPEHVDSSASSMTLTREDTGATVEEDTGDSESVCFRGEADG